MPRPQTRTRQLIRDDVIAITTLFGTARNAYNRLALEEDGVVDFETFRRLMSWGSGRAEEVEAIAHAWHQWRGQYLREDHPHPQHSPFRLEISQ